MYKTVNFNIYEENLEDIVYGENKKEEKSQQEQNSADEPIPKPPPPYWNDPLSYKRFSRGGEGAKGVL